MPKEHKYAICAEWKGNLGSGTKDYRSYSRNYDLSAAGKQSVVAGSSDPAFRGDPGRYNPEDLLLGSLSACHMLWVLHLCADAGVVVIAYEDNAVGSMAENADGSGQFTSVSLRPKMTITDASKIAESLALHERAHEMCYIARSVNFKVECHPTVVSSS